MRHEVVELNGIWKVWDSVNQVFITSDVPNKEIAQEIADDFNKMCNGDLSPLFE